MICRRRPLVAHLVLGLDVGGLENGLVNLLNRLPSEQFRHIVVCLKSASSFRRRIRGHDVRVFEMQKLDGRNLKLQLDLYRLFRREQPDIVHTRNLPCLDAMLPAALAGVPVRIHSEHGRNIDDADGVNPKHRLIRMLHRPFVHHYIAVSRDLQHYLTKRVGVSPARITQIYNGVDVGKFHSRTSHERSLRARELTTIGSVMRFDPVKDPRTLVEAVRLILKRRPELRTQLRLVIIGDGPLRREVEQSVHEAGLGDLCRLPGVRDDISEQLQGMDLFVMPSLTEGISNTILEAMATRLPVIATSVGGNGEVVVDGHTGRLVSAGDPAALSLAIEAYVDDSDLRERRGEAGRARVEQKFSLDEMVRRYGEIYSCLLNNKSSRLPIEATEPAA